VRTGAAKATAKGPEASTSRSSGDNPHLGAQIALIVQRNIDSLRRMAFH